MNYTTAKCGHSIMAIGAPGSPARAKSESLPCQRCIDSEFPTLLNELDHLKKRITEMNDVFTAIRMEVGGNTFSQELHQEGFDPDKPWLPVGLMLRIDAVMIQENRE